MTLLVMTSLIQWPRLWNNCLSWCILIRSTCKSNPISEAATGGTQACYLHLKVSITYWAKMIKGSINLYSDLWAPCWYLTGLHSYWAQAKHFEEMPARAQRFHLRMMLFHFSMCQARSWSLLMHCLDHQQKIRLKLMIFYIKNEMRT